MSNPTKSLLFTSPVHSSMVYTAFLCACVDLDRQAKGKLPMDFFFNSGESIIARARNNICQVFLNKECPDTKEPWTHLVMMDSDLRFDPAHVLRVVDYCGPEYPIVCGLAPLKAINWPAVAEAAKAGVEPDLLAKAGGVNVANPLDVIIQGSDVVEVKYGGSGFMCISREALLAFATAYPELAYTPDYTIGDAAFDGQAQAVTAFFDTMICPEDKRYLSEDYAFCHRARAIGLKTYVCRTALAGHIGPYEYQAHPAGV
jgi:hypothetical protein